VSKHWLHSQELKKLRKKFSKTIVDRIIAEHWTYLAFDPKFLSYEFLFQGLF